MADQRDGGIAWTDQTWNPVRGCTRVSEGCRNCYAEPIAARFSGKGQAYEGLARRTADGEARWTGKLRWVSEHLDDPMRWTRPRRVFVNSMSDLFHEKLKREQIKRVLAYALAAIVLRGHTMQALTKRAERLPELLTRAFWDDVVREAAAILQLYRGGVDDFASRRACERARAKLFIGVSVEDQPTADERILALLHADIITTFISVEPLLAPVLLWRARNDPTLGPPAHFVNWVIVGGESGADARPCNVAWIRSIVEQCKAARVPCFVKQLGAYSIIDPRYDRSVSGWTRKLADRKGAVPEEWPEDLRVREFPEVRT